LPVSIRRIFDADIVDMAAAKACPRVFAFAPATCKH